MHSLKWRRKKAFLTSSEFISDRHAAAGGRPWGRSQGNIVAEQEKKKVKHTRRRRRGLMLKKDIALISKKRV